MWQLVEMNELKWNFVQLFLISQGASGATDEGRRGDEWKRTSDTHGLFAGPSQPPSGCLCFRSDTCFYLLCVFAQSRRPPVVSGVAAFLRIWHQHTQFNSKSTCYLQTLTN